MIKENPVAGVSMNISKKDEDETSMCLLQENVGVISHEKGKFRFLG